MTESYLNAPNLKIKKDKTTFFSYRDLGPKDSIPLVMFNHLSATLDNWDPRLVDLLIKKRRIITFDYQGIGGSSGKSAESIKQMALDSLDFIHSLNLSQIDVLGLSMGGMVVQELLAVEPDIVRKVILAGTGPRGGEGISNVTKISNRKLVKAIFTFQDVKKYLFFTNSSNGKAKADEFIESIKMRIKSRDKTISILDYRRQLKAVHHWGNESTMDLSFIKQPTLVVNGEEDIMVPVANTYTLHDKINDSQLIIYPDSGHGSIFQNYFEFAKSVNIFL